MLLALWFDQWNPLNWPLAPTPAPPAIPDPGAGSGYMRATNAYWNEREAAMKRHMRTRRKRKWAVRE